MHDDTITYSECMSLSNYEELLLKVGQHLRDNEARVLADLDDDTYKVALYEQVDKLILSKFKLKKIKDENVLLSVSEDIHKNIGNKVDLVYLNDDTYSYLGMVVNDKQIVKDLFEIMVEFIDEDGNTSKVSLYTNKKANIVDYVDKDIERIFLKSSSGDLLYSFKPNID